jgi:bile acid:Na+ symporter, BASS family
MDLKVLIVLFVKLSISLTVFGLGLNTTAAEALDVLRRPRELGRAFLSMNVLMPALALAMALNFTFRPAVKIVLVALSVAPVPPMFSRTALREGGRKDYTVGLLVAMALLATVVIPVTMTIFQALTGLPLGFPVSSVLWLVLKTILIPLSAGVVLHEFAPELSRRLIRPIAVTATVLLFGSMLPVLFGSARDIWSLIGDGTILAFSVFVLAGLAVGYWLGGPDPADRRVLAVATSSRHPGVALAMAHANFPNQQLDMSAMALYLIINAVLVALLSIKYKRTVAAPPSTAERKAA